jgi:hypothetical protein
MKDYPSIPQSIGQKFVEIPNAYVFDKLDGSSMRSEWAKGRGWYKHGKRQGLVDDSNPFLAQVPVLFDEFLYDSLERIAVNRKWKHLIVFYEFWGDKSFAGRHYENDEYHLTVFDAAADKKGIMGPEDFRFTFEGQVETPACLGRFNWTRGFVQRVHDGEIEGITFEGVVGKLGTRHDIVRAKAKTKAWLDKVKALYGAQADRIINS